MKSLFFKQFLFLIILSLIAVAVSEAGTRVIKTSSARGSKSDDRTSKEEDTSKTIIPVINSKSTASGIGISENRTSGGNVRSSGNVITTKKDIPVYTKAGSSVESATIRRSGGDEKNSQIRTYKTTGTKPLIPDINNNSTGMTRTISEGYKTRNENNGVKIYKIGDDKLNTGIVKNTDYTKTKGNTKGEGIVIRRTSEDNKDLNVSINNPKGVNKITPVYKDEKLSVIPRRISEGYKTRNESTDTKNFKISDDKSGVRIIRSGDYEKSRIAPKIPEIHMDLLFHHEKIGNVREGGNVHTAYDKFSRGSAKATIIKRPPSEKQIIVRDSRHIIRKDDYWLRPHQYPKRYFYFWSGRWYPFPVACGHYPRYFYYWRNDTWCRVDRVVVYNTWVYNDYYNYDHVFVTNNITTPQIVYPEIRYSDFVVKGETEENLIVKTLTLTREEAERVNLLLDAEIIQNILASVVPDDENSDEAGIKYDEENGLMMITAPEELVLKIQTIIQDEATFDAFYNGDDLNAVDVIAVVSPVFLEKDYNEAVRLGESNFIELSRYLASLDLYYNIKGKKCWYNENIGTITVIDSEENLYRAWDYMNRFPYIPRDFVY